MTCARAAPPRCTSRGLRAYQRVTVHIQGVRAQTTDHARHTCAQNADHLAHKSSFSAFFVEVVCTVGATSPHAAAPPPPLGGNCIIRTSTRRRHAVNQLLVLQNPHHVPSHDIPNAEQAPEGTGGPPDVGPGCGARGRWRGLAGLRGDAPSEARGADDSRAGRRPQAHQAARPTGQHARRPEHPWAHKQPPSRTQQHVVSYSPLCLDALAARDDRPLNHRARLRSRRSR